MRFECAQTEISFLRKRLVQLEQRLESERGTRTGLEQKASAAGHGAAMLVELGVLSLLPGQAEAQKRSRLVLLLLSLATGLRVNIPKFLQAYKTSFAPERGKIQPWSSVSMSTGWGGAQ